MAFLDPELTALDEKVLKAYIADKDFAPWSYNLKEILRVKAHILSEEGEKLLSLASESLGYFHEGGFLLRTCRRNLVERSPYHAMNALSVNSYYCVWAPAHALRVK